MREMDAKVPCCVVPSSVYIDKASLADWKSQMAVCLIHETAGALALEIEDDVRKSVALKNVIVDLKCA